MDRIYYFRLTKETTPKLLPVFRKEIGSYEVYYLQVNTATDHKELLAVQSHMQKGIHRLKRRYREEEEGIHTYLVYEAGFADWLKSRQQETYWQKLWNFPLYNEYREAHNLALLLQRFPRSSWPGQLIILGEAPGLQNWIEPMAKHMREIIIYSLNRPRGYEELREKLLEEYGLMLKWEKSLQPKSTEPAMVLDYCGKENVFVWGIASGSIWIDMTSMESRRHGLEDRETGICYISLKGFWREEMIQTLDTANKILYNTGVN